MITNIEGYVGLSEKPKDMKRRSADKYKHEENKSKKMKIDSQTLFFRRMSKLHI